jgi:alpha-beta hydrolase superfamily lysophospholipase
VKLRTSYGITHIYSQKASNATERVLVLPGFSESINHLKPVVDALADEGYEALTFSPPRRNAKHGPKPIDPIVRQGKIIVEVLKATVKSGERVHAVAHSLGAASVLKAAQLQPEYFASLILMQPAGIVSEPQTVYELARRSARKLSINQKVARLSNDGDLPGRVARTRFFSAAIIAKQPMLAWREAAAAGEYDITEDLQRVADLGVPIHLVISKNDEMFDHDKAARHQRTLGRIVQSYTVLEEPTANHDSFWIYPQNTATIVKSLV